MAVVAYLGLALWLLRPVLADPWTNAVVPLPGEQLIGILDYALAIEVAARNARVLLEAPWSLIGGNLCFPVPNPQTLGEHMLGLGVLATPGFLVSRDPLFAMNSALLLSLVVPSIAMFALVFHFTRSAAAAFVGGLLFGFAPWRIGDAAHPFRHGDLWLPLVLLYSVKLVRENRWRDAVLLAAFASLQLMESLYSVLEASAVAPPFLAWVLWRGRRSLRRVWPKLAVAGAAVALVAFLIFKPYLDTRAMWAVLAGRGGFLNVPGALGYGGIFFPGIVAYALSALALADRARGPVGPWDPRLAVFAGGLLAAWISLAPVGILGWTIPAPLHVARRFIPGIDAVRLPGVAAFGVALAASFLAGYSIAIARRHLGRASYVCMFGLVVAATAFERFDPAVVHAESNRTVELGALALRPAQDAIDVFRATVDGPTVSLPVPERKLGALRCLTDQIILAAYQQYPVSACYDSFEPPSIRQVEAIAARLPDPAAAEALEALGFRRVSVFKRYMRSPQKEAFVQLAPGGRLERLGETADIATYQLRPVTEVTEDWAALELEEGRGDASAVGDPDVIQRIESKPPGEETVISFPIANRGSQTFRQPRPVKPARVRVGWQLVDSSGKESTSDGSALFPLALAPGDSMIIGVATRIPREPGLYRACLRRAEKQTGSASCAFVSIERGDETSARKPA